MMSASLIGHLICVRDRLQRGELTGSDPIRTAWTIAGSALNRFMASGKSAKYFDVGMGVLILLTTLHILLS